MRAVLLLGCGRAIRALLPTPCALGVRIVSRSKNRTEQRSAPCSSPRVLPDEGPALQDKPRAQRHGQGQQGRAASGRDGRDGQPDIWHGPVAGHPVGRGRTLQRGSVPIRWEQVALVAREMEPPRTPNRGRPPHVNQPHAWVGPQRLGPRNPLPCLPGLLGPPPRPPCSEAPWWQQIHAAKKKGRGSGLACSRGPQPSTT